MKGMEISFNSASGSMAKLQVGCDRSKKTQVIPSGARPDFLLHPNQYLISTSIALAPFLRHPGGCG